MPCAVHQRSSKASWRAAQASLARQMHTLNHEKGLIECGCFFPHVSSTPACSIIAWPEATSKMWSEHGFWSNADRMKWGTGLRALPRVVVASAVASGRQQWPACMQRTAHQVTLTPCVVVQSKHHISTWMDATTSPVLDGQVVVSQSMLAHK